MDSTIANAALVLHVSTLSHTEPVAQAVAKGLDESLTATVLEMCWASIDRDPDVALAASGRCTHAFSMTRATRADAIHDGAGQRLTTPFWRPLSLVEQP